MGRRKRLVCTCEEEVSGEGAHNLTCNLTDARLPASCRVLGTPSHIHYILRRSFETACRLPFWLAQMIPRDAVVNPLLGTSVSPSEAERLEEVAANADRGGLPKIEAWNADEYPPPSLNNYRQSNHAARFALDSAPMLWYFQLEGTVWDGSGKSYKSAKKKWDRFKWEAELGTELPNQWRWTNGRTGLTPDAAPGAGVISSLVAVPASWRWGHWKKVRVVAQFKRSSV